MKSYFLFVFCLLISQQIVAQNDSKLKQKVIVDNEHVKVTEFVSNPGKDLCGLGKHSHDAHLTVLLADVTVTVTLPDGKVVTQKMSSGTTFWSEPETHTIINSGTSVAKAQIIEYKKKK